MMTLFSIFITLLKLVLWILLGGIAFLALLLALVLCLPIDYRLYGEKYRETSIEVDVKFFYCIGVTYRQQDENSLVIKIFGIKLRRRQGKTLTQSTKKTQPTPVKSLNKDEKMNISHQVKEVIPKAIQQDTKEVRKDVKKVVTKETRKKVTQKEGQATKKSIDWIKELRGFWDSPHREGVIKASTLLLKRLLRTLKPHTFRFGLLIGRDDPAETGQLIAKLTMLYPLMYRIGWIEGVFDEKGIWGEARIEGRLRLGRLVRDMLYFILNKDVRSVIKMILK